MKKYIDHYKANLKGLLQFNGRMSLRDFWTLAITNFVLMMALGLVAGVIMGIELAVIGIPIISMLLYLVLMVLSFITLAPAFRRMQDTGKPGIYILVSFVPCVGGLILIYFLIQPGTKGPNDFGPEPGDHV